MVTRAQPFAVRAPAYHQWTGNRHVLRCNAKKMISRLLHSRIIPRLGSCRMRAAFARPGNFLIVPIASDQFTVGRSVQPLGWFGSGSPRVLISESSATLSQLTQNAVAQNAVRRRRNVRNPPTAAVAGAPAPPSLWPSPQPQRRSPRRSRTSSDLGRCVARLDGDQERRRAVPCRPCTASTGVPAPLLAHDPDHPANLSSTDREHHPNREQTDPEDHPPR